MKCGKCRWWTGLLQLGSCMHPAADAGSAQTWAHDECRIPDPLTDLLETWAEAPGDYDQEACPRLEKAMEENNLSDRQRFGDNDGT